MVALPCIDLSWGPWSPFEWRLSCVWGQARQKLRNPSNVVKLSMTTPLAICSSLSCHGQGPATITTPRYVRASLNMNTFVGAPKIRTSRDRVMTSEDRTGLCAHDFHIDKVSRAIVSFPSPLLNITSWAVLVNNCTALRDAPLRLSSSFSYTRTCALSRTACRR